MRRDVIIAALAVGLGIAATEAQQPVPPSGQVAPAPAQPGRGGRGPAFAPTAEDLAGIADKSQQIEAILTAIRNRRADAALVGDVEVYAKAGRFLVEFPDLVNSQAAMDRARSVLDAGLERARQLQSGQSPWTSGSSRVYAYYSEMDGSVQ